MTPAATPETPAAAPATRLPWIDTARGAALLLVITHHAVLFATAAGHGHPAWTAANETLRLVRMPLFFFLSGLLAARAVQRPWPDLLRRRVSSDLWVYLLWATAAFTVFSAVPYARGDLPAGPGGWLAATVLLPGNGAWYLLALALFLVAARLLRHVRTSVLLAVAGTVSAVAGTGPLLPWSFVWNDTLMLFVFFAAGLRLRSTTLTTLPRTPGLALVAASTAAVGALALTVTALGLTTLPGVRLLVGAAAVLAGLLLAARLAPTAPGRALAHLGRRTLGVYVTHEIVLGLLVLTPLGDLPPGPAVLSPAVLTPAVLVLAALAVCLPLGSLLGRVPFLLNAPWAAPRSGGVRPRDVPVGV